MIITALPEERDAVLSQLDGPEKIQLEGSPTYYRATVPAFSHSAGYDVAVTMLSHMGNIEAAQHTFRAIEDLHPDYVLMVGIAGGVKGQVRLGDVVVSKQVLYYEQAKQKPGGPDQRPMIQPADPVLLERAQNYTDITWLDHIHVPRPARGRRTGPNNPQVVFGPIAAGEKIIADVDVVHQLKGIHSKVSAIDMESFGVAVAAANTIDRPRFLAIRGISDYADPAKNDQWHAYAAASAAAFAIGFLRAGPVKPRTVRVTELAAPNRPKLITIQHQSQVPIPPKAIADALPPEFEGYDIDEVVIDQSDLYSDGRLRDPKLAALRQKDLRERLNEAGRVTASSTVAYYGIAHIPLLFYAGYLLSDQQRVRLFDFDRHAKRWSQLQGGGNIPELRRAGLPRGVNRRAGDVIMRISVSYPVTLEAIPSVVRDPLASIHLALDPPVLDAVTSERQVSAYGHVFRRVLDDLKCLLPKTRTIHLFYAGPAGLAFHCGQQISKTIHPHVVVYNYSTKDEPPYAWGLTITKDPEARDFVVYPPTGTEVA